MGLNRDRSDLLRLRSLGDAQAHKRHWVKIIQSTSAEPVKLHQTTAIEPLPPKAVVDHGHSCSEKANSLIRTGREGPKCWSRGILLKPLYGVVGLRQPARCQQRCICRANRLTNLQLNHRRRDGVGEDHASTQEWQDESAKCSPFIASKQ